MDFIVVGRAPEPWSHLHPGRPSPRATAGMPLGARLATECAPTETHEMNDRRAPVGDGWRSRVSRGSHAVPRAQAVTPRGSRRNGPKGARATARGPVVGARPRRYSAATLISTGPVPSAACRSSSAGAQAPTVRVAAVARPAKQGVSDRNPHGGMARTFIESGGTTDGD